MERGGLRPVDKIWQALLWMVLGFVWLLWFQVFCGHMWPRFAYLSGKPIGIDAPCVKPECDFSDFWRAGLTARFPGITAPPPALAAPMAPDARLPLPNGIQDGFPYPPPALLPSDAIAHLKFETGFFVWIIAHAAIAIIALRWARLSWLVILAGLLSPAALWNMELGQYGVVCGAILLAGLLRQTYAPGRAGLLLSLLSCKPQYGILLPSALFGARSWRGLAAISLACFGIVLLTSAFFGFGSWWQWLHRGGQSGMSMLAAPFNPFMAQGAGTSSFWMLHSLGVPLHIASLIQAMISVFSVIGSFWVWRSGRFNVSEAAGLTILLTLLATPYGYVDDMVAGSWALAVLAQQRAWRLQLADMLFWIWPAIGQITAERTGILLTPFVVGFAFWRVWRQAERRTI